MRVVFLVLFALSLLSSNVPTQAAIQPVRVIKSVHSVAVERVAVTTGKSKLALAACKAAYRMCKKLRAALHLPQEQTNGLAIASLACGVGGLVLLPLIPSIAALILGIISLNQIKRTGEKGEGLAIAGIVLGGIGILAGLIVLALILAFA